MKSRSWWWKIVLGACFTVTAWGGTFGKVVAIGGHAADIALDEARGVLYVANFTANRIEVMSLADNSIGTSINVAPQPGSLALSPDGRYLVVAHFGNFQAPDTPRNALTVIDLSGGGRQTFALGNPPLGVAFGLDNQALVVTSQEFLLFDPVTGATRLLDTITGVTAKTLPQPPANFPPQIIAASVAVSGDGMRIYGLTDTLEFGYEVASKRISVIHYVSSPAQGPRVVSVNQDGSSYLAGWALNDTRGTLMAQFPNPTGALNVGGHVIDSARGLVYAEVPESAPTTSTATPPQGGQTPSPAAPTAQSQPAVLQVLDADNLTVRERLTLPEHLAGRGLLSSDGGVMYAVSDSGVTVLPVGALDKAHRLQASQEDLVFRGSFCERQVASQEITISNPGGGSTDFSLTSSATGVRVTPNSGVTPATVRVSVDPSAFQNQTGTVKAEIEIKSQLGLNIPAKIRVLINLREPDQRGTVINIAGKLVDLLADPVRDRFYVLRQDKNQVLVFDGATYGQIATLRTGNTPTQMAVTFDRRYLLVGNNNSQIANVYDLDTLEPAMPIRFPGGHYPRSIAASGKAILAACRVAGPKHKVDRVDMLTRSAQELPSLGIYENDIHERSVLAVSPNGASILLAQPSGVLMLYNANADTFTLSRKDPGIPVAGAYAASSYDQFVVGSALLNASLVKVRDLDNGTGASSGFAFIDQMGFRTTASAASNPGVIQKVNLLSGSNIRPTRMAEAPLGGDIDAPFTRTLAPLYSRGAIVNLTVSGFTVVGWNYDEAVAPPRLDRIVNAADGTQPVAPGGLINALGQNLSPVNIATREKPWPTALGESCLTVNGVAVPMVFVSPDKISAQLPFQVDGNVTAVLHTPGGVSDNFNMTILPAAPSVFRNGVAGPASDVPTVLRQANGYLVTPSNPVHRGDWLEIYLTGMGRTSPAVEAGMPAPGNPPASVLIPPDVTLGGVGLPVSFAGLTPGEVGLYQINARVPSTVPLGMSLPLTITQGSGSTTIDVRVVE